MVIYYDYICTHVDLQRVSTSVQASFEKLLCSLVKSKNVLMENTIIYNTLGDEEKIDKSKPTELDV